MAITLRSNKKDGIKNVTPMFNVHCRCCGHVWNHKMHNYVYVNKEVERQLYLNKGTDEDSIDDIISDKLLVEIPILNCPGCGSLVEFII